jgi:16S rRNA (guanine527-N7)-methyltransferase
MVNGATMSAEEFGRAADVSRETLTRLQAYEGLLQQWQAKINLVSRTTLSDVWHRHFLDSAQLGKWVDPDTSVLDMGSGAGFPGMVLSIMRGAPVLLAESDSRKSAFLREVRRITEAPAEIFDGRVESIETSTGFDLIVARALAPVSRLLELARPLLARDGYCIFMKGAQVDQELEEAAGAWTMDLTKHPSVADPRGVILEIRNPDRVL